MLTRKHRIIRFIISVVLLVSLFTGIFTPLSQADSFDVIQAAIPALSNETRAISAAPAYVIDNEVIVDNDICVFKIVKASDDFWGFTLKAYCENKTSDKTLMFSLDEVSVNSYLVDPLWAEEVLPGKKPNSEITFMSSELQKIGIIAPDEITFELRVYDSNDWFADSFVQEVFTIYPTGLKPGEIIYPERKTSSSERILFDNGKVTFIILETAEDSIWGYTIQCYLENKTEKTIMFSWDDVSVNGFMIDPFWAKEVPSGKKCYSDISFSTSDFENNDISNVENIEFTVRAYDSEDWFADDIVHETMIYKP